jgi:CBS domain containing-hemolysin-like protein
VFLLIAIVASALSVSALCSILEAVLLSSRPLRLAQRKKQGDRGATILLDLKEHHIEDSISAILTYNTLAHTVGAALAGAQAAAIFGSTWLGVFSGVLTLLILIFTEIIPKTLGTVHADKLSGFAGRVIRIMILPPMKWLLYLTRTLTRVFSKSHSSALTRGDVMAMVEVAERDGAIDNEESVVLSRVLRLDDIKVKDIMTPRTVMAMCNIHDKLRHVIEAAEARAFSRLPVYTEFRDAVQGYVLMRELLTAAIDDPESLDRDISPFVRNVPIIDETVKVGDALQTLTSKSEHVAVVLDEMGVLAGLVTLEDLFETVFGIELIDELDEVVDLRKAAIELRDKRLARMKLSRSAAHNSKQTKSNERDKQG